MIRSVLALLVGVVVGVVATPTAASGVDECQPSSVVADAGWQDRAALLDPDAYRYFSGNWSFTVPAGETWHATNLWWAKVNGVGPVFHRPLGVDDAMPLPAGTVVSSSRADGFAWVAQPSTVISGDSRYDAPHDLYEQRIDRLRTLPRHLASAHIPAGSPQGTWDTGQFDSDFERGMVVHVSTHDTAWTILGRGGGVGGANLDHEISDDTPLRFAGSMVAPFKRSVFPEIMVRSASMDSFVNQTSLPGAGVVQYVKLPDDW